MEAGHLGRRPYRDRPGSPASGASLTPLQLALFCTVRKKQDQRPLPGFPMPSAARPLARVCGLLLAYACRVPRALLGREELMPHIKEAGTEPGQVQTSSGFVNVISKDLVLFYLHSPDVLRNKKLW